MCASALQSGDHERAAGRSLESLRLHDELGQRQGIAECLGMLAAVACRQGRPERAARLLGAVAALQEWLGAPLPPAGQAEYRRTAAAARAALGENAFRLAWNAGTAMPLEQAMVYAVGGIAS